MQSKFEAKTGSLQGVAEFELTDPRGLEPTEIIDMKDGFHLNAHWVLTGAMVPMLVGDWKVVVYAESIGHAFEGKLYETIVDIASGVTANPHRLEYNGNWPVSVMNIKDKWDGVFLPGPYKLVAVLTCQNKLGHPGPLAAFTEFPIVQFYIS